ncbi:hypothetical protein [Halorarum halobium]|uniref:hypothetical protein n=1 Tax=Halorarum halobium TaxID=3075121 RepID=UPI0028B24864|nr:hypothetical protein [Halobaculum sp. XH14]
MPSRRPGDLAFAFVGWYLLAFAPVVEVGELLTSDLVVGDTTFLVVAVVALPLAVGHWLDRRSVGPLGAMFFWTLAFGVVVGLPLAYLLDEFGVAGGLGEAGARLLFLAVVYGAAYAVGVRRRADARLL